MSQGMKQIEDVIVISQPLSSQAEKVVVVVVVVYSSSGSSNSMFVCQLRTACSLNCLHGASVVLAGKTQKEIKSGEGWSALYAAGTVHS